MIHYIPPRLTPAQARDCESLRVTDISARIGQYLTLEDRESARRVARHLLRETVGKDWSDGTARLARAAQFGTTLAGEVAKQWKGVTIDCHNVLVLLLMNDRLVRYLRLYGGREVRTLHDRIARESERAGRTAQAN